MHIIAIYYVDYAPNTKKLVQWTEFRRILVARGNYCGGADYGYSPVNTRTSSSRDTENKSKSRTTM